MPTEHSNHKLLILDSKAQNTLLQKKEKQEASNASVKIEWVKLPYTARDRRESSRRLRRPFTVNNQRQPPMSYQGQQLPGPGNNGTWSGNGSPQRQQYWVDQQQMPPQANSMAMNGNHHSINHQQQYYTAPPPPHNGQPMYQNQNHNHNQFQQNGAYHPNVTYHPPPQLQNQNHAPQRAPQLQVQHQHAPPPPQPTNTQFINPSEIFSNPPSNQNTPQRSQMGQRVSSGLSAKMAPARPGENAENGPLMMALAEEYIEAAHALAPTITSSMTAANLDEYHKLIAMGLALLESALKNTKLAPRDEAKVRLRYAGVLYEETNNSMEAETALSKGISLCERVCEATCKPCHVLTFPRINTRIWNMLCIFCSLKSCSERKLRRQQ